MKVLAPKAFVFVLMPFSKEFNDIYRLGIKSACEEAGAKCERIDEQIFVENILERVHDQISKADIIVSEMTGRNPNVFYETGYAYALKKKVILLTQKAEDIPFDLKHYPHIIYGGEIVSLRSQLVERIRWCINNPEAKNETTAELSIYPLSLHIHRTAAYGELEEFVRSKRIKRADLLQFSGNTAHPILTEIALQWRRAKVRLLLAHPDVAASFDSDSGADSVNHRAFIDRTVKIAKNFGIDAGYYRVHPSMSILILNDNVVSLGWYRTFPADQDPSILRLRGHDLPAINVYTPLSLKVLNTAQGHFNTLWKRRERLQTRVGKTSGKK
jgi:hypothetical protein